MGPAEREGEGGDKLDVLSNVFFPRTIRVPTRCWELRAVAVATSLRRLESRRQWEVQEVGA